MVEIDVLGSAALRGAVTGLGSGLFALALVATFRVTGVLNLALGGIAAVAAFVLWGTWADGSVPLLPALVLTLAVAAVLGLACHVVLLPLERAGTAVKTVATLGLLLVAQGSIAAAWGPGERVLPLLVDGAVGEGDLRVGRQQLLTAAVTVAVAAALAWWVRRRPSGTAALAVGEDPRAARLLGLPARRLAAVTWVLAAVLAGAAGVLLSGLTVLNGSEMTFAMMSGLAAALVAGFDRLSLAVAAAAGVGSITAMAGSLDAVAAVPGLTESLALVLVLVAIVVRPAPLVTGPSR
jgi:branched-subunit amino acid ABC-type transport system permease component